MVSFPEPKRVGSAPHRDNEYVVSYERTARATIEVAPIYIPSESRGEVIRFTLSKSIGGFPDERP